MSSNPANKHQFSASQQSAPTVFAPRSVPPPSVSVLASFKPVQPAPPSPRTFPLVPQPCLLVPSDLVTVQHAVASQHAAPLVRSPRPVFLASPVTLASSAPRHSTPLSTHAFLPSPGTVPLAPSNFVIQQSARQSCASALPSIAPRHAISSLVPTAVTLEPVKPLPPPVRAFPSAQEHVPPGQQDAANAILNELAEKVARLREGLEAILANPGRLELHEPGPKTT